MPNHEENVRSPLGSIDLNAARPTMSHADSLKRLKLLEMQLAAEREKVANMRTERLSSQDSCTTIFEDSRPLDSLSHDSFMRSSSASLLRMNSCKSNNSNNSVSTTPIFTHADMDKTGTVQAYAELRDRQLFRDFQPRRVKHISTISSKTVMSRLKDHHGLRSTDPRLASMWKELSLKQRLTFEEFVMVKDNCVLMDRALTGQLIIPDFRSFAKSIKDCYIETKPDLPDDGTGTTNGDVARYIPSLAKVDPSLYGVAVCSIDGQQYSVGHAQKPFCIQSTSKPLTYGIALELHGEEKVHSHVGCEPSGRNFNARSMLVQQMAPAPGENARCDAHGNPITSKGIPHNPCINAGAIMVSSLVKQEADEDARFDYVVDVWRRLAGGRTVGFQNSTYMGERATADRNFCLGYMMKEEHAFPEGVDLVKTLESYFMYCSLEMDAEAMAIVASTLANGGVCPVTGERVFQTKTVQRVLSIMQVAGMYDYSGEFAFRLGFPCKSGVSGVLCIVIPGVCGIATFSPRLDQLGNSVKGIQFCHALNKRFPFHEFASLRGCHKGRDITASSLTRKEQEQEQQEENENENENEARESIGSVSTGMMARTSSCSIASTTSTTTTTTTSTSDAVRRNSWGDGDHSNRTDHNEEDMTQFWYASAAGELMVLRQLAASGVDVNIADYDRRSALHLAASEGHEPAVRYLLAIGADTAYTDRYGNRALEDSIREGHEGVELVLRQHMGEMVGFWQQKLEDEKGVANDTEEDDDDGYGLVHEYTDDDAKDRTSQTSNFNGFRPVVLPDNNLGHTHTPDDADAVAVAVAVAVEQVEQNHQQEQQKDLYQGSVRWLQLLLRSTQFVSRALARPLTLPAASASASASVSASVSASASAECAEHSSSSRVCGDGSGDGRMMRKIDLLRMLNEQGIHVGDGDGEANFKSSSDALYELEQRCSATENAALCTWNGSKEVSLTGQLQMLPDYFNRKCFQQICVDPLRNPTIIKCLTGQLAIPHFPRFITKVQDIFQRTVPVIRSSGKCGKGGDQGAAVTLARSMCDMCTVDGQQLGLNSGPTGVYSSEPRPSRSTDRKETKTETVGVQWVQMQDLIRPVLYCLVLEQERQQEGDAARCSMASDGSNASSHNSGAKGNVHRYVGREPAPSDATEIELNPDGIPFNPFTMGGAIMTMSLLRPEAEAEAEEQEKMAKGALIDGIHQNDDHPSSDSDSDRGASTILQGKVRAVQELCVRLQGGHPCRLNERAFSHATLHHNHNGVHGVHGVNGGGNKEKCMSYMMKASGCMAPDQDELRNLDSYFMCHALESTTRGLAVLAATLAAGGVCPTSGERVLSSHVVKSCLSLMHTSGMGAMSGEFQFRLGVPSKCARGSGNGAIIMAVPNVLGVCYVPNTGTDTNEPPCPGTVGGNSNSNSNTPNPKSGMYNDNDTCSDDSGISGLPFCESLVERFGFHRHDQTNTAGAEIAAAASDDNNNHPIHKEDPTKRSVHWHHDRTTLHGTSRSTSTAVVTRLLSAASIGDTMAIKAMHAAGCDLECADYDRRTAAHLAAATGHLEVLRYFASNGVNLEMCDRWGGTCLDDAEHEGHTEVARSLRVWLGIRVSEEAELEGTGDQRAGTMREGEGRLHME